MAPTVDRCPICAQPLSRPGAEPKALPFCSNRCRMVDLGRWLGEGYAVPVPPAEDGGSDREPPRGAGR